VNILDYPSGNEVHGRVINVFLESIREYYEHEEIVRLATKGSKMVSVEGFYSDESWYPHEEWLKLLTAFVHRIAELDIEVSDESAHKKGQSDGPKENIWYEIGKVMIQGSGLLEDVDTVIGGIDTVDDRYYAFHRGDVGHIHCVPREDDTWRVSSETVYPCSLSKAIFEFVVSEYSRSGEGSIEKQYHQDLLEEKGYPPITRCIYILSE